MKINNILKAIIGIALFASTASATTTYNFTSGGLGLTFDKKTGADFNFVALAAGLSRVVTYNEVTKQATVTLTGNANVNGVTSAFSFVMNFLNVIPITNPAGVLGFSGTGATSSGTLNIANVGDANGDGTADSALITLSAKFMNFAGNTTNPYNEIANLGNANFFLWNSASQGSILAKAWYQFTNISLNGANSNALFNNIYGDMHLAGGSQQVPEPASVLLLGMGALGGVIRRRKSA